MRLWARLHILAATGLFVVFSAVSQADTVSPLNLHIDAQTLETVKHTGKHQVDPWERYNRVVFKFNDTLDRFTLKPLARGYRAITPQPVEIAIANAFDNLLEITNITNDILQWKWGQAANDSGRFVMNSTFGILGFFDVASHMGMPKSDGEDFGQTAAKWGSGQGHYLVLPFFGPSTFRDTLTLPANIYTYPVGYIEHLPTRNSISALRYVAARSELLEAEKLISGDRYIFVRDAYLQRREFLINDGNVEDEFFVDDDEFSQESEF